MPARRRRAMAEPQAGLEALRPLHTDGPGPLADPWLWLALGGGLALAALIGFAAQRGPLRSLALQREARAELRAAARLPAAEAARAQALLLRRIARTCGGEATRELRGEAWLAALDGLFATTFFTEGRGRRFGDDLYAPTPDATRIDDELAALVKRLRRQP